MLARFSFWIFGLAVLMMAIALPTHAEPKRVALVIGNAAYKHAAELRNPRNDAQDVAAAFQRLGFTVISGVDLDHADMRRTISRFASALENATVAVFYYAGHGMQLNGTNYLVPTDSKLENQYSPAFELVPVSLIQRVMENQKRTNILFFDAAHENPLARNLARALGSRTAVVESGSSPAESGIGTLISFSQQPGKIAPESTGRNSPYAASLVRQLRQAGVPILDMLLNVRRDVMLATQSRQIPWEHSALTERFYFTEPGTAALEKSAQAPSARAEPDMDRRDVAKGGAKKKHAFVVGIDRYDNLPTHAQLRKAVGDSREMAKTLTALGFEVTSLKEPTRGEFVAKWHSFLEQVQPGDALSFVFSGHGIEIEGANYLLMRDIPRVRSGREGQLRSESISFGQLQTDMREREPSFSFVVLDACRDNPFEEGGRTVGGRRGLGRIEALEGTFVMYSAGAGQKALDRLDDSDKAQTSVFTRTLLPLMRKPGLSLLDMADQVGEQVRSLALSTGHNQTPAFYSRVIGGRHVCLAGCDAPSAPLASSGAAEVVRVCREVEQVTGLTTLSVLELQHKGTPAGDCISARMGELKASQTAAAEAEQKRVALLSKPRTPEPIDRTMLTRQLHRELGRVGCYPGAATDSWSPTSQKALQRFAEIMKLALHTDEPTQAALDAVASHKFIVCPRIPVATPPAPDKPVDPPVVASPSPAIATPPTTTIPVAATPPPKFTAPPAMTEPAAAAPRPADVSPPAAAVAPVVVAPTPPATPPTAAALPGPDVPPASATPPATAKPPKAESRPLPRAAAVKSPPSPSPPPTAPQAPFTTSVERENKCRLETETECRARLGLTGSSNNNSFHVCGPISTRKEICPGSRPAAVTPTVKAQREKKCRLETFEECRQRFGSIGTSNSYCPQAALREICR